MKLNKDYRRVMEGGRFHNIGSIARRNKWHSLWIAVVCFTSLFLLILCTAVFAQDFTVDEVVEAIGKAENSTKYPYGIKSIDTKGDIEYAKRICRNSVVNNYKRWVKAGKQGDFLEFMSRRYCPINAHKLNKNWVGNVKFWLIRNREAENGLRKG